MMDFSNLLTQGGAAPWLFIPTAILLGALHGLEPGHSKTMMAAFIVAIRGTVWQAILLGLAATLSHTMVVWLVAMGGMYLGSQWDAETSEPYFQLASAVLIIGVAAWMFFRIHNEARREKVETEHSHHDHHHHSHGHHHHHHDEGVQRIDTGHGVIAELAIKEDGVPPRFWLAFEKQGRLVSMEGQDCAIETIRPDGSKQTFALVNKGAYLESAQEIPEPHEFTVRLSIAHDNHSHDYDVMFSDHHHHEGLDLGLSGYQDAHELAHANDIKRRFAGQDVTTGQIVVFGLTGGLIPCPAAITVLLLCLQLKQVTLGAALVVSFSIGLALTLVASGVVAALSVRYASKSMGSKFATFARRAPYFSVALIMLIGLYVGYHGLQGIFYGHAH
jgi:nickel/cobalt exporter